MAGVEVVTHGRCRSRGALEDEISKQHSRDASLTSQPLIAPIAYCRQWSSQRSSCPAFYIFCLCKDLLKNLCTEPFVFVNIKYIFSFLTNCLICLVKPDTRVKRSITHYKIYKSGFALFKENSRAPDSFFNDLMLFYE